MLLPSAQGILEHQVTVSRLDTVRIYTLTSEHFKYNKIIEISSKVHTFFNFFFQNEIGFIQKHYHKAVLDLQEELQ